MANKCVRCGNGVSGTGPCRYCAEADRKQAEQDEALAVQLERLVSSGRLAFVIDRAFGKPPAGKCWTVRQVRLDNGDPAHNDAMALIRLENV